jgi:hypothetical protein
LKKKLEVSKREYELLNRAENLLERKKIAEPIVAGKYKKTKEEISTKEELSKRPILKNLLKKLT